jgi:hypothetical protein
MPVRRIYLGFTLLAISCPASGGVQVAVEGSVPRAGQERRPFGMGEGQHRPRGILGVPDEYRLVNEGYLDAVTDR